MRLINLILGLPLALLVVSLGFAAIYTVEMVNDTESRYISFRVITGSQQGHCLTSQLPEAEPFIPQGQSYNNFDSQAVVAKVCGGKLPCYLKIYEGTTPNCDGNEIGTTMITTDGSSGNMQGSGIFFIITHNTQPGKYILNGNKNFIEIKKNPSASWHRPRHH